MEEIKKKQRIIEHCKSKITFLKGIYPSMTDSEFEIWNSALTKISEAMPSILIKDLEDLSLRELRLIKVELDKLEIKLKEKRKL